VPLAHPRFDGVCSIGHLQPHWLAEFESLFADYKALEGKQTTIEGWSGVEEVRRLLCSYPQAEWKAGPGKGH
jgi:inorganic pyrophosphatase